MKHTRSSRLGRTLVLALLVIVLGAACSQVIGAQPLSAVNLGNGLATPATTYPIVDTGQTRCYNNSAEITCPSAGQAFSGQDGQAQGNQPSYTLSTDGLTVYDNVTGLTWMQSPDTNRDGTITYADKLTYTQAQAVPAALNAANYGGYGDWRLPTIKELYSLINFSGTDTPPDASTGTTPFIDTDYFGFSYGFISEGERIIDSQWATSTKYVATTMGGNETMFGVNFADGRIKGYPTSDSIGKKYHVLCVRGSASYGLNSFVNKGDGTVTDSATGLMWAQADSGSGMNWQSALAWVQTKNAENYLGHDDWRLPNAKELQSIVDYTRSPDTTSSAAIAPIFTCTQITNEGSQADYPFYWTGTTHASSNGSGGSGVYVAFGRALGYMNGTWLDVHGAGAQRSDPKAGVPNPYGHGPQGDVIRIYNYVRLVRDVPRTVIYLPVIITQAGEDVVLTWTDDPANTGGYQVWSSAAPYFVAGDADSEHTSVSTSPYMDGGAVDATKYYVVLGVDGTGQTVSEANRVGVFSFSLAPGAQGFDRADQSGYNHARRGSSEERAITG